MTHSINGENVHVEMSVKDFTLMCAIIKIGQAAIETEKACDAEDKAYAAFYENNSNCTEEEFDKITRERWRCRANLVKLVKEYNQVERETGGAL